MTRGTEVTRIGSGVEVRRLPYGRTTPGGEELTLLVHRHPDTPPGAPMLLDVHGGAWTWFTAAVDRFWCRELAARGYVVAAAELTSAAEAPWPAARDDVAVAAAWLRTHAAEIGGDPHRLGVIGGSTGGHQAAVLGIEGDARGRQPDAVVALWPIGDVDGRAAMARAYQPGPLARRLADRLERRSDAGRTEAATAQRLAHLDDAWCGGGRRPALVGAALQRLNAIQGRVPPLRLLLMRRLLHAHELAFPGGDPQMRAASPVHLCRGTDTALPPLHVVHAAADTNTTEAMSRALVAAWRDAGGAAQLDVVAGVGHSYGNIPSRPAEDLVDAVDGFLRRTAVARPTITRDGAGAAR